MGWSLMMGMICRVGLTLSRPDRGVIPGAVDLAGGATWGARDRTGWC